jgi:hypothetical protein
MIIAAATEMLKLSTKPSMGIEHCRSAPAMASGLTPACSLPSTTVQALKVELDGRKWVSMDEKRRVRGQEIQSACSIPHRHQFLG